ncbi:MAG: cation:proton antiporter regulatory subunit, partial [Nocardioides sp.]
MGKRVAHLVRGRMLDYIEVDDDYAFVKTSPPSSLWGQRLADTGIRSRLGVTVVGVKRAGAEFTYATADSVLEEGDLVIVSGTSQAVERFSELS